MLLALVACLIQNAMGLVAGQSFIPQVNGKSRDLSQFSGKALNFGGLAAHLARKMQGIAHHDPDN